MEAFVGCVAKEAGREPGTLVLPMTEQTTLPLSAHRDAIFAVGGRMVLPEHETVLRAFDKEQTTRLAQSLGIRTPRTVLLADQTQASEVAHSFQYPAVLKPRSSERVSPRGEVSATGRPAYARNVRDFLEAYEALSRAASHVLAQEFIAGTGSGYFALMRYGELRAEFAHRRIRDVIPTGSGSALRMSVRPYPEMRDAALNILKALKWHGVAMVEFRIREDLTPVFLEVNGRFWASLALALHAGIDFPALLAQIAENGDAPAPPDYRVGVRCRWLLGDFRHLLEVLQGAPSAFPSTYPGRLQTLFSFVLPVPGTFHDNFELRDPLPELGDWLDFLLRRLPREMRRKFAFQIDHHAQRRTSHP